MGVLHYRQKNGEFYVHTLGDVSLADAACRFCGACTEVCPTGAIQDKEELMRDKNRKAALVPCKSACPAEIDVPRYVRLISEGDYAGAAAVVREKAPFPLVLGYVCDHPCEDVCRRGQVNEADRHPRTQALRGRTGRWEHVEEAGDSRGKIPASGWPSSGPAPQA